MTKPVAYLKEWTAAPAFGGGARIRVDLDDKVDDWMKPCKVTPLVPLQAEPKGEHPTSRSFRDLADSHEAQGFNDMIAFTPTALRRFADQIDAIHTPEADRWVLAERLLRSAHSELALEPDNAALTQRIGEWLGLPENRT